MTERARDVFQGNDWLTYRWPVAQAFDTLDRIRDLCHSAAHIGGSLPQLQISMPSQHEITDDNHLDLYVCLLELCDSLSGEMDSVHADILSFLPKDIKYRWMGFEMRLHLVEMRHVALMEHQDPHADRHATDTILALASRIRDLLRQIDQ